MFGCDAYVHIPKDEHGKLDPKAKSRGRVQEGGWGGCNPLLFCRRQGKSTESERGCALSCYATSMWDQASTLRTYVLTRIARVGC